MKDEPDIMTEERDGNSVRLAIRIDPDIVYFKGHFEDFPILPGVAQVHWAIRYGCRYFDLEPRWAGLQALKFKDPVFPEALLTMTLEWHPESRQLSFALSSESGIHSSGRIRFRN